MVVVLTARLLLSEATTLDVLVSVPFQFSSPKINVVLSAKHFRITTQ